MTEARRAFGRWLVSTEELIAAVNGLTRAEHEQRIVEAERLSLEAADEWGRRFYAERAARYRAMRLPGGPV